MRELEELLEVLEEPFARCVSGVAHHQIPEGIDDVDAALIGIREDGYQLLPCRIVGPVLDEIAEEQDDVAELFDTPIGVITEEMRNTLPESAITSLLNLGWR